MSGVPAALVVSTARGFLGVPFLHQGRSTRGVDCSGLIVLTVRALGISDFDVKGYPRQPDGRSFEQALRDGGCVPGPVRVGALLFIRFYREPQHVGFVTDYVHGGHGLIHSYSVAHGVVEHRLDDKWLRRTASAWTLPGVDYGASA